MVYYIDILKSNACKGQTVMQLTIILLADVCLQFMCGIPHIKFHYTKTDAYR